MLYLSEFVSVITPVASWKQGGIHPSLWQERSGHATLIRIHVHWYTL